MGTESIDPLQKGTQMARVKQMDLSEIKPYDNNPRRNDEAVDPVARSIKEFGFNQPIVIDADNTIVVGHTRWKAAVKLGLKKVPVLQLDIPPEKAKAYRIADNQTSNRSEWDPIALLKEVTELQDVDLDLDVLAFETAELDGILESEFSPNESPTVDTDAVTDEDIGNAQDEADEGLDDQKVLIDVTCPECGNVFSIEKEK